MHPGVYLQSLKVWCKGEAEDPIRFAFIYMRSWAVTGIWEGEDLERELPQAQTLQAHPLQDSKTILSSHVWKHVFVVLDETMQSREVVSLCRLHAEVSFGDPARVHTWVFLLRSILARRRLVTFTYKHSMSSFAGLKQQVWCKPSFLTRALPWGWEWCFRPVNLTQWRPRELHTVRMTCCWPGHLLAP